VVAARLGPAIVLGMASFTLALFIAPHFRAAQ